MAPPQIAASACHDPKPGMSNAIIAVKISSSLRIGLSNTSVETDKIHKIFRKMLKPGGLFPYRGHFDHGVRALAVSPRQAPVERMPAIAEVDMGSEPLTVLLRWAVTAAPTEAMPSSVAESGPGLPGVFQAPSGGRI